MSSNILIRKRCEFCYKEFDAKTTVTRFCSHACNSKSYKARVKALKIQNSNDQRVEQIQIAKTNLLDKEFLTVNDIADLLGFSKRTVYVLINSGKLNVYRLSSRKTRIKRADFFQYIEDAKSDIPTPIEVPTIDRLDSGLTIEKCYPFKELLTLFKKSNDALYTYLKRAGISKIKVGREVYYSRLEIDRLYRKFIQPKLSPHDKERAANERLATKGLRISECYTMEQCEEMFQDKRGNLYGRFSRRNVPKIQVGKIVYYSKKAVDRIYNSIRRGGVQ